VFRTIGAPAAIVACRQCKQVQICQYSEPTDAERPVLGRVVSQSPRGDTVLCTWLKCDEETCHILLPVFAQWNSATSEEERRGDIATWLWDGLHCPAGHSISAPRVY